MFCPSCGNQNPEQATQCARCGAALQAAAKPQKFKGTMMMSSAADIIAPGFNATQRQPPPPQVSAPSSVEDMLDAPTIMQAPGEGPSAYGEQRAALTQPQGTSNVNATMAMDASAFGLMGAAPAAPPSAPPPEHGASTVAVDASAFGLGGAPGPGPNAWSPQPQKPAQPTAGWNSPAAQPPAPQAPMQQQAQPEISTGGIASTVAVDISQFGLGGAGGPPNPYAPPQGAPPQGPQGQGGYGAQGMQPGMQPGVQQGWQQGMHPGMQQGMQQGMHPGMHPGMQQGMQPGMQQGWQPQPMSPLQPPPASVSPPGGSKLPLLLGALAFVLLVAVAVAVRFLRG